MRNVKTIVVISLFYIGLHSAMAGTKGAQPMGKDEAAAASIRSANPSTLPSGTNHTPEAGPVGNGANSIGTDTTIRSGNTTSPGTGTTSTPVTGSGSGAAGGQNASGGK